MHTWNAARNEVFHSEKNSRNVYRPFKIIIDLIASLFDWLKTLLIMGLLFGSIALSIPIIAITVNPELLPEFKQAVTMAVAKVSGLSVSDVEAKKKALALRMSENFPVFTKTIFGENALVEIKASSDYVGESSSTLLRSVVKLATFIDDSALNLSDKVLLATLITTESRIFGVDPLLTTAIINTNNSLKENAKPIRNRIGLMQLTPEKAEQITSLYKTEWKGEKRLTDPIYNLQVGLIYLSFLESVYKDNLQGAVVAFRLKTAGIEDTVETAEKVPEEVTAYADRVLAHYSELKKQLVARAR